MAKVLVEEENLQNIANTIRAKNKSSETYQPRQMASAIAELSNLPDVTVDDEGKVLAVDSNGEWAAENPVIVSGTDAQVADAVNDYFDNDPPFFELPSGGEAGQALLSDGEGGVEWGNVSSDTEAEIHNYTYVKPNLIRCAWNWDESASGNFVKTDVKETPQFIILNKAVACNANGANMFSETSDFATPLVTPFSHIFKMTYPVGEMVPTYLYGEDQYKYMRMMLPYSADLEVTFVYDTWRPSNDVNELNTILGNSDIETKIGFAYPESTARMRALAVVPFYPDKTYYFHRSSYMSTLMSGTLGVFGVWEDNILGETIPASLASGVGGGTSAQNSYSAPYHFMRGIGSVTNLGNNYVSFDGSSVANLYPKYLAFPIAQITSATTRENALANLAANTNVGEWDASIFNLKYPKGELRFLNLLGSDYDTPFKLNPLVQSKWVLFGDSLTDQYCGRNYNGNLPVSRIAREFFINFDNRAYSGSHICTGGPVDDSTHNGVAMLDALIAEVEGGADAPDYVTFAYGSNGGASNTGTIESTSADTATTIGAMKYCIEKMREKLPNTVFGFILPPQSTWNGGYGRNVAATREAMLACLNLEGYQVPYCDMWTESGITADMLPDKIHIRTEQTQNLYYHALRRFMIGL